MLSGDSKAIVNKTDLSGLYVILSKNSVAGRFLVIFIEKLNPLRVKRVILHFVAGLSVHKIELFMRVQLCEGCEVFFEVVHVFYHVVVGFCNFDAYFVGHPLFPGLFKPDVVDLLVIEVLVD